MPSLESAACPLSVAIIGGGIAGVTLTIALLRHSPHISVTLYESASAFGEVGAGVGFQPNFVRTMFLVHPGVGEAFETCSQGTPENADFFHVLVGDKRKIIIGSGDNIVMVKKDGTKVALDEEVFTIPGRWGKSGGVHRGQFLDELVKLLPPGISKFEKRLVDVTEAHDGSKDAVLHFADGTTAQHTAVLGCDGIHSRTREIVLGDVEEAKAVFSGKICYRGLLEMSKAVELLGTEKTMKSQMYLGQSGHVLTYPVANGRRLNVISFATRPTWDNPKWIVQASREQMLRDFDHWGPSVRSIMENLQTQDIWALFNHAPAKRYFMARPRICLVGDAAHASTPHQGAGAGMCIEDAYILSHLLGRCKTGAQVVAALHAFDFIRRPRTQRLVETSREAGLLWDLEGDGVGDDLEAFQRNTATRMAWIWDHDITKDKDEAIRLMETLSPTFEEAKL